MQCSLAWQEAEDAGWRADDSILQTHTRTHLPACDLSAADCDACMARSCLLQVATDVRTWPYGSRRDDNCAGRMLQRQPAEGSALADWQLVLRRTRRWEVCTVMRIFWFICRNCISQIDYHMPSTQPFECAVFMADAAAISRLSMSQQEGSNRYVWSILQTHDHSHAVKGPKWLLGGALQ